MMHLLRSKSVVLALVCSLCHTITAQQPDSIITLDLSKPTIPAQIMLNEKGYWTETYNTANEYKRLKFGLFSLTHIRGGFGGGDVGGGMSYWDGFTYCTSGDTTDYGEAGSSDAWVAQQWGCMAGGGIKTDANGSVMKETSGKVSVQKGNPYLVAYWGYWLELKEGGAPCLQVDFTDGKQYQPVGVYVANHPWPYYGNVHGDGFAQPFTQEGDYFKLIVHGLNAEGEDTGSKVEHMMAEFKNGKLIQSIDWEWIDLSKLGTVNGIYFTMETSDADPIYGPNTAVYFCMDNLQVKPATATTAPSRPTGLKTVPTENSIDCSWTASSGTAGVQGYNLYLNDSLVIFEPTTHYLLTGLSPYTSYLIDIVSVANDGTLSEKASITTLTTDETLPTAPLNLTGTSTQYSISLSWDASTDNVAVTEYHIYLNGERQKRVYTTNYTLTGLDAVTNYFVEVEARDAAGNRSNRASVWLSTSQVTSITTSSDKATQDVYPNPTSGIIYINTSEDCVVQIYNLRGTPLMQQPISRGKNVVDLSHLSADVYILRYGKQTKKIVNY